MNEGSFQLRAKNTRKSSLSPPLYHSSAEIKKTLFTCLRQPVLGCHPVLNRDANDVTNGVNCLKHNVGVNQLIDDAAVRVGH